MKKLICLLLALCFVFALAACGNTEEETKETTGEVTTQPAETTAASEDDEPQIDTKPTPTVDPNAVAYTVKIVDEAGNVIEGVERIQICSGNDCRIMKMADGPFQLEEKEYTAKLVSMPEGYDYTSDVHEFPFDETNTCTIVLKAVA